MDRLEELKRKVEELHNEVDKLTEQVDIVVAITEKIINKK